MFEVNRGGATSWFGIPEWARTITLFFSLYHLVELTRYFCIGAMESNMILNLSHLVIFILIFGHLALLPMKRRLIK